MKTIKCLISFILTATISYLISSHNEYKIKPQYFLFNKICDYDTSNVYKENGRYISLYNFYDRKYSTKIVDTPQKASEISYVLFNELFNKDFMAKNIEFNLISVNDNLWAIYDKSYQHLLLLFQKRDCKVLYINVK